MPTWNAAFVYDTQAGAQAALEILRVRQLAAAGVPATTTNCSMPSSARIYKTLQRPRLASTSGRIAGTRKAARQVHALFIDVNELTDRTENALKFIGDIYAARLFGLVGRSAWARHLEGGRRGEAENARRHLPVRRRTDGHGARASFLELIVVVILVLELVLILLGIMK